MSVADLDGRSMHEVTVVDGPLPEGLWDWPTREPDLVTAPELIPVLRELIDREPLFHRKELGISRAVFEQMTAETFWEVGASGKRFSRAFVLDVLDQRYKQPAAVTWKVGEFHCFEIAADNYLLSYTLDQGGRITRRSTIWRRTSDGWKILYHQGTPVL